jgi:hypothetical protein
MLVNRYSGTLEHPKAVGIMQRTAELLRLWGAEDEIRRRGVPPEFCDRMVWTTTLSGEELGRTETVEPDDRAPEPQSQPLSSGRHASLLETKTRNRHASSATVSHDWSPPGKPRLHDDRLPLSRWERARRGQAPRRSGRREAPGSVRLVLARLVPVSSRRRVDPCMRFSRTRLTDVLHRRRSTWPASPEGWV